MSDDEKNKGTGTSAAPTVTFDEAEVGGDPARTNERAAAQLADTGEDAWPTRC